MSGTRLSDVRVERVAAHVHEVAMSLEQGAAGWLVPRFLGATVFGIAFTVFVPALLAGDLMQVLDPSQPLYWTRLLGPSVLAAPVTWWEYRRAKRMVRAGVEARVREIERELAGLTGPGWVGRTLRMGALGAAAVGVPVGLLMAGFFPTSELPGGSRALALLTFVGMTALWTFPAAFGIRWLSLKSHRRLTG
jgi:hypothetical protein